MLNSKNLSPKDLKKINRIKIASRTLENIYKDLKFTMLENIDNKEFKKFNLKDLIVERVEYFTMHMESKRITKELDLKDFIINGDRELYARMLDNIISNAIKYNRVGGKINIYLRENELIIEDSGVGIDKKNIEEIFNRYSRFNSSEGGFGIGLSIVRKIADYYNLDLRVESKKDRGTRFIIRW
jgi:two-component system OmpR family sensor kinase